MEEEASKRIQARFITKLNLPDKLPASTISIPSNLTRMGLSAVLNNLLKTVNPDWVPEPFDFLVHGELVRMSLEQFLLAKGISAEKTLEIEYVRAVAPRKNDHSLHDDWVTAVDGSHPGLILTGCCDGLSRVWKTHDECTHFLDGHKDAVNSVVCLNPEENSGVVNVATASKDRTVRLWKFAVGELHSCATKVGSWAVLKGHNASVQTVAAEPSGSMICSGSWDCTVNLWKTNDLLSQVETTMITKKRKVSEEASEPVLEVGEAPMMFTGHTQCVSSVTWNGSRSIYSASWDRSVRKWDVETGRSLNEISSPKALNCVDAGGEGSALVVAGGSDSVVRVWDPRSPSASAPVYQFSSRAPWVSACRWHRRSAFHLLSASYDGRVTLWDLRTAWPLSAVMSHTDRALCADWWKHDSVVSGGADSRLSVASGISIS